MLTKKVKCVKYSPVFKNQLAELYSMARDSNQKVYRQLIKSIKIQKDRLLINPHAGIQIEKCRIPQEYIKKYGLGNLWKLNLSGYWRMFYTIVGNELEIISILLEFMDHKQYNKLFGYKKK